MRKKTRASGCRALASKNWAMTGVAPAESTWGGTGAFISVGKLAPGCDAVTRDGP